ncbi:MAG: hypothetical protein H7288_08760 [Kineosporiaceae bacterium]|nr:hypothetical protein [Aeromicrobium sp.]
MRLRWLLVFGLVASATLVTTVLRDRSPVRSEYCTAKVGTTQAQVDLEQAQWSSLMAAIGLRRGLPPRATTIAIATAFQESKVHNIDYGDRDSVGLFQQRPSQGWGTVEQILDPHYSIGKFFDGLVKVKGYAGMEITAAAQKVQRSAYPGAYAQHENDARALASALTGYSQASFSCQLNPTQGGNIDNVDRSVQAAFGKIAVSGSKDALAYPMSGSPANQKARGWALAQYLVANAAQLKITGISFDGRTWTAVDSPAGWVKDSKSDANTVRARMN